jgi:hypothetical protein
MSPSHLKLCQQSGRGGGLKAAVLLEEMEMNLNVIVDEKAKVIQGHRQAKSEKLGLLSSSAGVKIKLILSRPT